MGQRVAADLNRARKADFGPRVSRQEVVEVAGAITHAIATSVEDEAGNDADGSLEVAVVERAGRSGLDNGLKRTSSAGTQVVERVDDIVLKRSLAADAAGQSDRLAVSPGILQNRRRVDLITVGNVAQNKVRITVGGAGPEMPCRWL